MIGGIKEDHTPEVDLENEVERLKRELDGARLALTYAVMKLGNTLEIPDVFLAQEKFDFALVSERDPYKQCLRFDLVSDP